MRTLARILVGLACLTPLYARAQGFNAEIFRPATSTSAALSQDTAHVLPRRHINVGLTLDYAHNPLVLRDPVSNAILTDSSVLANRLVSHLGAAYGVTDFLEFRARVPVIHFQDGNISALRANSSLSTTTVGDLSVGAKAALLGRAGVDGFKLAVAADLSLPSGSADDFAGDGGFSFRPRLVAGIEARRFSAAISGGYAFRGKREITPANLTVDDQVLGGLALGYALIPRGLWALGEVYFAHVLGTSGGVRDTPVEAIVGARYALPGPWMIQGGVGLGLTSGAGAPGARAVLALAYATDTRPPSSSPARPTPPPPPPPPPPVKVPAPDPDSDGDGIIDRLDKCPNDPEDKDGFEDDDGCPDPDNDKDEIPDVTDKCPDVPEDRDGFEDDDGCPDPDNDKDGLADAVDKCPNQPEVFNGFEDSDGCPDKGAVLAELTDSKIEIKQQINFATGKAKIKKGSFKLLATVAKIMMLHPELTRLRVEGHTDDRGTVDQNMKLSQSRADSVRMHLIEINGIEAGRLKAVGHGPTQPIANNKTGKGRAANRRSEFIIIERAPAQAPPLPGPPAPPADATLPPPPANPSAPQPPANPSAPQPPANPIAPPPPADP